MRLLTFLKYDIPAGIAGMILVLVVAAIFAQIGFLIVGLVLLGDLALKFWMWRQIKRGRVEQAATAICVGIAVDACFVALFTFIAVAIVPLLFVFAIMVALPYVSRRRLLSLIIGVTLLSTVITLLAYLLDLFGLTPFPLDDVIPAWLLAATLIIGLPTVIGLILLVVWQYGVRLEGTLIETQAANQALRTSERTLEANVQELQQSRARIVKVQEGVRRDIASHLHGRTQGRLLLSRIRLQRLLANTTAITGDAEILAEVIDEIDSVIHQDLRVLTQQLYPSILSLGTVVSLESLGDRFAPAFSVEMRLDSHLREQEKENPNLIPEPMRLAVYRIAEEALTNAVKHANATRITVGLDVMAQGELRITIEDDGQGFDSGSPQGGIGLAAIQDHAGALGGDSFILSGLDQGARITAKFPFAMLLGESQV
jgi:signal transduction histidine kinase